MSNLLTQDELLMSRFQADREQGSFTLIYNKYFVQLAKYIGWLCDDMEVGKDLTQQLFIKLYQRPELFDVSQNFKTWIFVSAKNQWKNHMRKSQTAQKYYTDHKHAIEHTSNQADISPTATVPNQNKMEDIMAAINMLPEAQREVFLLKYSSNLTIQEISEVCSCSAGTVKSRLFYSIMKLRSSLKINQNHE